MDNLEYANKLIEKLEESMKNPKSQAGKSLYTGVDLGTSAVVITVVDESGQPVGGAYEFADVVRDGMVVDYAGAIAIVSRLKDRIEADLGQELFYAAVAIPPGTESIDGGAVRNVAEAAGFEVLKVLDEPTAANSVLKIKDGAVVDIGGGTTGISIIEDGRVKKTLDEATGGKHFSLVLAGAMDISYEDAEQVKRDFSKHKEIFPILAPVIDKIRSIIETAISGYELKNLVLVGGTALLTGIESYIEKKIGIKTVKPVNPMFVTPLGLAINLIEEVDLNGY